MARMFVVAWLPAVRSMSIMIFVRGVMLLSVIHCNALISHQREITKSPRDLTRVFWWTTVQAALRSVGANRGEWP